MSAPLFDDAAFRWTESGQDYLHYLGSKLRRPVADTWQQVHGWTSPDGTTIRRVAIGSGVEDLRAQIRYDGMTDSLRRFMAAARRGASLEYFPSLANPSESYPCVLMSDDGIELDADFWWNRRNAVNVVLRRIDGGNWLGVLAGSLFYWKAGNLLPGLVFTRSTTALALDQDGLLQEFAANVPRTEYVDLDGDGIRETPTTPLEGAATNLVLQSDNFNATWTGGFVVVTTSGVVGPDGAFMQNLEDNSASVVASVTQTLTIPANTDSYACSIRAHKTDHSSNVVQFAIALTGGGQATKIVLLDLSDGSLAAGAGSAEPDDYSVIDEGSWWRIWLTATNNGSSTGMTVTIAPSSESVGLVGNATIGDVQVEVGTSPTDYIPTTTVAGTRGAETWYAPYPHAPSAFAAEGATLYAKWIERGTRALAIAETASKRYVALGESTGSTRVLLYSGTSGLMRALHGNGTNSSDQAIGSGTFPVFGDVAEMVCQVYPDGSVQPHISINGAAVVSGARGGTPVPFASAWETPNIALNSTVNGTASGAAAFLAVTLVPGVKTLAEMRAA